MVWSYHISEERWKESAILGYRTGWQTIPKTMEMYLQLKQNKTNSPSSSLMLDTQKNTLFTSSFA